MERATRRVTDPFELSAISKFKEKVKSSPDEPRLCPANSEAVNLDFLNFNENTVGAPPFEAVFSGCCEAAIQSELRFIQRTLAR
jgi:hypothetical protein